MTIDEKEAWFALALFFFSGAVWHYGGKALARYLGNMIRRRRMEQSGKGEELGNAPIRPS